MSAVASSRFSFMKQSVQAEARIDRAILAAFILILSLGLIMVASASMASADRALGSPFYYFNRQLIYIFSGLVLALMAWRVSLQTWLMLGPVLLVIALVLLTVILIPGIGHTVNGSTRWLNIGLINVQVSELIKLVMIIYLAGYLTRHSEKVKTSLKGFLMPVGVVALVALLLLSEPDFGATVVLGIISLGMLLLAGVRLRHFLAMSVIAAAGLITLALTSPYRLARLTSFVDPWKDPFNSGFQLSQSLIAFGRGEWLGVGLGGSVQKLFYLPEAHTDFLFAVLAEELGVLGALFVIALFLFIAWRIFQIAHRAEQRNDQFGAYLSYGIGLWMTFQAYVNIGVNMGVLPTKGLTLPLMSYGGSSLIIFCVALGILMRVDYDNRNSASSTGKKRKSAA